MPSPITSTTRITSSTQAQTSSNNQQVTNNTEEGSVYFQQSTIENQDNLGNEQLTNNAAANFEHFAKLSSEIQIKILFHRIINIINDNNSDYQEVTKQIRSLSTCSKHILQLLKNETNLRILIKLIEPTGSYEDAEILLAGSFGDTIRHNRTLMNIITAKENAYNEARELFEGNNNINTPDAEGNTPLIKAAKNNNLDLVVELLKLGANVSWQNQHHDTALHLAALQFCRAHENVSSFEKTNYQIAKLLIENGASINLQEGCTSIPLEFALLSDNSQLIELLIEKGGNKQLELAVQKRNFELIELLVENGADPSILAPYMEELLNYAIAQDYPRATKFLIERGANINKLNDFQTEYLLYLSSKFGYIKILELLLEKGIDIRKGLNTTRDPEMSYDTTALHVAAKSGNLEVIKLLIRQGIPVDDFRNLRGQTSLHSAAAKKDNLEVIEFLVENGANVNLKDKNGETPLHLAAAEKDNLEVIEFLVENGANVNLKDKNGETPLHLAAAEKDNLEVIEFLVENGANVNLKDKNGETPLHLAAAEKDNLEVIEFLVGKGADIKLQDNQGNAALHFAAETKNQEQIFSKDNYRKILMYLEFKQGNLRIVKFLVEKGADINLKNQEEKTALDLAIECGNDEIAKYLTRKMNEANNNG